MIIYPASVKTDAQEMTVTYRVASPLLFPSMPRSVQYKIPLEFQDYVQTRADAPLAALFFAAMAHGQDLQVDTPVSAHLYHGLLALQELMLPAYPHELHRIEIRAPELDTSVSSSHPPANCAAFSGGVDSFHTLWKHIPQNDPDPASQLTHGLFVRGLDIQDPANFTVCYNAYRKLFNNLNLELLTVSTNAREWYAGLEWSWMYPSPLTSNALLMGRTFDRFYLPSNSILTDPPPWDLHADFGRYFSTDTMRVIDDQPYTPKGQKLLEISQWDATYDHLRVCWKRVNGLQNCGKCTKCLNTMTGLEIAGALDRYTTFPHPLTGSQIRSMNIPEYSSFVYLSVIASARQRGREDIARNLEIAMSLSRVRWMMKNTRDTVRRITNAPMRINTPSPHD